MGNNPPPASSRGPYMIVLEVLWLKKLLTATMSGINLAAMWVSRAFLEKTLWGADIFDCWDVNEKIKSVGGATVKQSGSKLVTEGAGLGG